MQIFCNTENLQWLEIYLLLAVADILPPVARLYKKRFQMEFATHTNIVSKHEINPRARFYKPGMPCFCPGAICGALEWKGELPGRLNSAPEAGSSDLARSEDNAQRSRKEQNQNKSWPRTPLHVCVKVNTYIQSPHHTAGTTTATTSRIGKTLA